MWLSRRELAQKAPAEEAVTQASSPDNKDIQEKVADSDLKLEDIEGEGDPNGRPLKSVKKESKKIYENALTVIQELQE